MNLPPTESLRTIAILTLTTLLALPAEAATPPKPVELQQGLEVITAAENDTCGNIEPKGSSSSFEATGKIDATLPGALKKLIDLGGGVDGKYSRSEYEGYLQKDLLALKQAERPCRQFVFMRLLDLLYPPPGAEPTKPSPPTVPGPAPSILSDAQMNSASDLLGKSPGRVRLVMLTPVEFVADMTSTPLVDQMRVLFAKWRVEPVVLGGGGVPPGITVVGAKAAESVRSIMAAFDAARIPYKQQEEGYTGPGSLGPSPATVLVGRTL